MKTVNHTTVDSGAGSSRRAETQASTALIESRLFSRVSRLAFSAGLLSLLWLAWPIQAQTPCPGSVAQMVRPAPGTTLPGSDVTFTFKLAFLPHVRNPLNPTPNDIRTS